MSLYKLVKHLREYVNSEEMTTLIEIKSYTTQNLFHYLSFKYKNMKKDVFIDGHKWSNIIKNHKKYLKKIKELKLYLVKFNENNTIKEKNYLANCTVGGNNYQPVIIITHDRYTFFANDRICKTWT